MKFFNRHFLMAIVFLFFVATIKSTNEIQKSKFSTYRGVWWHKITSKWHSVMHLGGNIKKRISGGYWESDLDAAKMVNKICDDNDIPHKNEDIGAKPMEQKNEAKYKCVYWINNRKKWAVSVYVPFTEDEYGEIKRKRISGRGWDSELDAAKQVNKICDLYGLKHKNPGIGSEPNQYKKNKSSDYTYVTWKKHLEKWLVYVYIESTKDENGKIKQKRIYGGSWDSEIDAAKQVNKICDLYRLKHKNPGIGSEPNQYKKSKNKSKDLLNEKTYTQFKEETKYGQNFKNAQNSYQSNKRKRQDSFINLNEKNIQTENLITQNDTENKNEEINVKSEKSDEDETILNISMY